jgi:hypothetical protein
MLDESTGCANEMTVISKKRLRKAGSCSFIKEKSNGINTPDFIVGHTKRTTGIDNHYPRARFGWCGGVNVDACVFHLKFLKYDLQSTN